MNTYTIQELENAVKETGYKYIALYTSDGKQLIPYNNTKPTVPERVEEIKKRLKSPSIKDGIYIVRAKNYQSKDGVYDEFPIQKGTGKIETLKENVIVKAERNPEVTSYKEVLKLQNRITELEFELRALQKDYDDLEEKYEDQNEELEELKAQPQTLAENKEQDFFSRAGTWLQDIITTSSPLIEKHFELKEKALNNETARLMLAQGKMIQTQQPKRETPPPQNADPSQQFVVKKIQEFITQFQDDEQKYEELANIFNTSTSLDDFYLKMKEYDAQTFDSLIQFINSKK